MEYLKGVIKDVCNNLDDLDTNSHECDENGNSISASQEFKDLLLHITKFVENYK